MFKYGIEQLTLHTVKDIANGSLKAIIDSKAKEKIISCRKKVETIIKKNKAVYGINTGFGPLCDFKPIY
jgi:histidine ammonia-lyase